jgi:DNA-directed RNA polymerase specialized sigma24 family protein
MQCKRAAGTNPLRCVRCMANRSASVIAHSELFRLCAVHHHHDEHWAEFVRRFNPLLVRSITVAWRKGGQGEWPPPEIAADLLQDVYTNIVKNDFQLLRHFRGNTDAEAEAYLAHAAIHQTYSFVRHHHALRRYAPEVSLHEWIEEAGEPAAAPQQASVSDSELVRILNQCIDGPNRKRDILIFVLYARDGYSVAEIARLGVTDLKETSIANLIGQIKARLKKCLGKHV